MFHSLSTFQRGFGYKYLVFPIPFPGKPIKEKDLERTDLKDLELHFKQKITILSNEQWYLLGCLISVFRMVICLLIFLETSLF